MKKLLIVMGAALMLASCNSSNVFLQEWDTPYGIPPFDKIKIGDYMPAIKAGIEQQNAEIQAIIDNQEAPSFENTAAALCSRRSTTCCSTSVSRTTPRSLMP